MLTEYYVSGTLVELSMGPILVDSIIDSILRCSRIPRTRLIDTGVQTTHILLREFKVIYVCVLLNATLRHRFR